MLFNYKYVNHSIENFQLYLDHLVKEVWCKATSDFSLDLLDANLRAIILEIYNVQSGKTRGKTGDWLYGPISRIYEIFKTQLSSAERAQVAIWYDRNNDIEKLCTCDLSEAPATYADIRDISVDLEIALKNFCKSLFTDVIYLKAVTSRIGEIESHYKSFISENGEGKCPYCGYGDIKGLHHRHREAYDHFLPKGTYPFNSVNFRNLAPMCHECNSTYKLSLDPLRNLDPITRKQNLVRRKAFYSYSTIAPDISIAITVNTSDAANISPADIDLQLSSPGREEEVESWNDVFGISERYKAKCCGANDGRGWIDRIQDECQNYGLTPQQMFDAEIKSAQNRPWTDSNFLKMPFLLACKNAKTICQ